MGRLGNDQACADTKVPELQPLLGSVHHYAVWDDHDYGPNDADRSYRDKELSRPEESARRRARRP